MNKNDKKIKVLELFAGIGCQNRAMNNHIYDYVNERNIESRSYNLENIFEIKHKFEWFVDANIIYDVLNNQVMFNENNDWGVGHSLGFIEDIKFEWFDNEFNLDELKKWFKLQNFSIDSKNPTKNVLNNQNKLKILKQISDNNLVDLLDDNKIDQIVDEQYDLITYSFPCQGISNASFGKSKGVFDQSSTSHLLFRVEKIISSLKNKPKYLIMENVMNLIQKYKEEYSLWVEHLNDLGYYTYTFVLDGSYFGTPQQRKRVFNISIRKDMISQKERIYLESLIKELENKQVENDEIINKRKQWFDFIFDYDESKLRSSEYDLNQGFDFHEEYRYLKDTPSRQKIVKQSKVINDIKPPYKTPTLTTKQDRFPNGGIIRVKNPPKGYLPYRFLTNRELMLLMGFSEIDYKKVQTLVKHGYINNLSVEKVCGNGIVIGCLVQMFHIIYLLEQFQQ